MDQFILAAVAGAEAPRFLAQSATQACTSSAGAAMEWQQHNDQSSDEFSFASVAAEGSLTCGRRAAEGEAAADDAATPGGGEGIIAAVMKARDPAEKPRDVGVPAPGVATLVASAERGLGRHLLLLAGQQQDDDEQAARSGGGPLLLPFH